MFKDVPPADAYVLKLILHDWDDASCATILCAMSARASSAAAASSRIDNVHAAARRRLRRAEQAARRQHDAALPGKERTRVEWEALYRGAGLAITAMIPVPDAFNMFVIEGRRVAD